MKKMSDKILQSFKQDLMIDGKATKTVISYTGDIRTFLEWLEIREVQFQGNLQRFFITQYKEYLLEKKYAIDTINKKINSLASFNDYLIRKEYTSTKVVFPRKDKIKIAKGSEGEVEVFSYSEIERVLFYLENKDKVSLRNKLIVHMLLYTGVRASELINIEISNIDFLTSHLIIRNGKGGKMREIPIKGELLALIKEYLDTERKQQKFKESPFLFISERSKKMDRDTTNKVLKRIGRDLKIKMFPHKFRHTFATLLIQKGVNITTVSSILGHSNIQTTVLFYVNTSREEKQQAVNLI